MLDHYLNNYSSNSFVEISNTEIVSPKSIEVNCFELFANSSTTSLLDFSYLTSIVLLRNEIKTALSQWYIFKNDNDEIDFIAKDFKILNELISFSDFFKGLIEYDKLELELMDEDDYWKTLFINFYSEISTKEAFEIFNLAQDRIVTLPKNISGKLNFSITPYEI